MNTKICAECMYNVNKIIKSKNAQQKRSYCSLAHRFVRTVVFCPEGYNMEEYENFLAKCEEYDSWAAEQEQKADKSKNTDSYTDDYCDL